MAKFITKIQHKTFEKGEFAEERERSLKETLQLINDFPWDIERPLTDIQLTGPSVTISDNSLNFLKIGLYFNGKFCLYYLNHNNQLYEYHAPELEIVKQLVTQFFENTINLTTFEKHYINIGNRAHFETRSFEYRQSLGRIMMLTSILIMYVLLFFLADCLMLVHPRSNPFYLIFGLLSLFFYYFLYRILRNAFINRNAYLQISKGNPVFSFGNTTDTIRSYNKSDIQAIVYYESTGSRNPNRVDLFEVQFRDGSSIRLTNMLIGSSDFRSKFTVLNGEIPFKSATKGLWRLL